MSDSILLAGIDEPGLATREVYERRGGYGALRRALEMTPEQVLAELEASNLRGRGAHYQGTHAFCQHSGWR